MRQIVLAIGVLIAAVALLCVGVILRRDHTFRSQHIGENQRMKQDGIRCANTQDREARRIGKNKINTKNI